MRNFKRRSDEAELMDAGDIPFAEFHECLRELETINVLTRAYPPSLRWVRRMMQRTVGQTLCILDAGSGGGDMVRRLRRQAARAGRSINLIGVDLNPWSKQSAELSTVAMPDIRFETADIFTFDAGRPVDIILCSLFTHHLTEPQLIGYLRWANATARRGWFINDLHRHWLPYYFIKAATALCSRNRLIRHDAAVSVARSFTKADWRRLLVAAGIADARIRWHFPFRLCVSCETI